MARIKSAASDEVTLPPSSTFDLNSLVQGGPDIVAVQTDVDIRKLCEDEAFMNEMIDIVCKASGDPNAPKAVEISIQSGGITGKMGKPTAEYPSGVPGVAGRGGKLTRFVFALDKKYTVPRFVFEALAHAKMTSLRQAPHPTIPMMMTQRSVHSYSYAFECTRDPNPKGQAWREKVLADPA